MIRDPLDEAADIADHLAEQMKFYVDIGIESIGSPFHPSRVLDAMAKKRGRAAPADPTLSLDEPPGHAEEIRPQEDPPRSGRILHQPDLFGEVVVSRPQTRTPVLFEPTPPKPVDESLEDIRADIGECTRCKLHEHRTNIVFGEGSPSAQLMFIGEGPGADEDASGRPFVGRAGQLLDKIIASIGLRREEVYIANVVKCRPPGNRVPERDETATCQQFLFRQIAAVRPRVIVTLGAPAFQCVLQTRDSITRARGQWRDWQGIRVMPTFHPAYLLRSPDKKRETWQDMKKVRDYLSSLPRPER
jgi:uracil-DNA glycosylase